ncbi:MAG: outer membrane receptor protein involved in Fe transport, partial [Qipengyuania sp.]
MKIRTTLFAGAAIAALSLPAIAHAGEVVGTVSDASDTIALRSAQIRIVELDRVATSERDGSFLFADVPAGEYTLEISYVGAETVTRMVSVPATGAVRADIAMSGFGDNEILVIGQAANLSSALSRKKEADGVSDVLTRDAIGQFPDQNVAESLRRLPGVNVLNDQGEGRFVSVRGLAPDLVSSSLNGVRLPSPEADVRSVALDVISSDIIESIEVKKSLTPDMDADTIGASVEIETTSAFDR